MPLCIAYDLFAEVSEYYGWFLNKGLVPMLLGQLLGMAIMVLIVTSFKERWSDIYVLHTGLGFIGLSVRSFAKGLLELGRNDTTVVWSIAETMEELPQVIVVNVIWLALFIIAIFLLRNSVFWQKVPPKLVAVMAIVISAVNLFITMLTDDITTMEATQSRDSHVLWRQQWGEWPLLLFLLMYGLAAGMVLYFCLRDIRTRRALATQQQAHYQALLQTWQDTRRLRHDLQNHLQTAAALGTNGGGEAETYIQNLQTRLQNQSRVEWCQNPVLNAVLYQKSREAEEKGVALAVEAAAGPLPGIDGPDLMTVAANLVDNAIEASRAGDEVRVGIRQTGGMLVLRVENPLAEGAKLPARPGLTTKKSPGHRVGLGAVRAAVEKYGGSFSLTEEDGRAVALASLMGEE